MSDYFDCPICGEKVSVKAKFCPECGSDEQTGWSEAADYIHLLPDKYDRDVTKESPTLQSWFKQWGILIILVMITGFVTASIGSFFAIVALIIIGILYLVTEIYPKTAYAQEKILYRKLLQKTKGNSQLANRLIQLERERTGEASQLELIKDAIARWEKDNK